MGYELLVMGGAVFLLGLAIAALIGGSIGFVALLSGLGILGAGAAAAMSSSRAPVSRGRDW